jgi:hypothetical protein
VEGLRAELATLLGLRPGPTGTQPDHRSQQGPAGVLMESGTRSEPDPGTPIAFMLIGFLGEGYLKTNCAPQERVATRDPKGGAEASRPDFSRISVSGDHGTRALVLH